MICTVQEDLNTGAWRSQRIITVIMNYPDDANITSVCR